MFDSPARIEKLHIEPGRRVLAVSDVHGCLPYLRGLLEKARFGGDDLLIFDGDFLEKGEQSLGTLRCVMRLCAEGRAKALLGNCDDWAGIFSADEEADAHIDRYVRWKKKGLLWDMYGGMGLDAESVRLSDVKEELRAAFAPEWDFLSSLPHAIETERFIFAHAGVHAEKPLEAHTASELYKFDDFLSHAGAFDKWVIVGHWPVVLYHENIVDARPVFDRERRIVSIDGGCVLKDDGQLNALVLPAAEGDDFSFVSYDAFPRARALDAQEGGGRSYYIRWGDSRLRVLRRGAEFSLCRHLRTGYEMEILTKYLFSDSELTDCNDCTDYVLPISPGDEVSVVETSSRGYFVKRDGVSGWYRGRLEAIG